jgi:hypothetical protein
MRKVNVRSLVEAGGVVGEAGEGADKAAKMAVGDGQLEVTATELLVADRDTQYRQHL